MSGDPRTALTIISLALRAMSVVFSAMPLATSWMSLVFSYVLCWREVCVIIGNVELYAPGYEPDNL